METITIMKKLLCKLGLHNWKMMKKFITWKCKWCGKIKEEAPW